MKVVIVALGSAGDVHPLTGLALALKRRGHRPLLAASPLFRSLAERSGIPFTGIGTEEEFAEAMRDPDIWHPLRAFRAIVRRLILPSMRPVYELLEKESGDDTIAAAPVTALGARVAAEKLAVPLVTVHLQPVLLRSSSAPPCFGFPDVLAALPRSLRPLYFRAADRFVVDPLLAPGLNAFRAEKGMPPVRRVLPWADSPDLVLGLFPPWFAEPQPDWPRQTKLAGFPLYDEGGENPLPENLAAWCREGDPPVVFTAGSANIQAKRFFSVSAEICRMTGIRGLFMTRFPGQAPKRLPGGSRICPYAPFSSLFPHAAAVVHHGGIGTVAQALAAGLPQLVVPFAHDQPDNACRVRRLGAGTFLTPARYRPRQGAAVLSGLLESASVRETCLRLAAGNDGEKSRERACELVETAADGLP